MANNFVNEFKNNISAEETLPTEIYYNATKKAICIELDAANKSSAGVTVGVSVEDTGSLGAAQESVSITSAANGTFTKTAHGLNVNDRIVFTISANAAIASGSSDTNLNSSRYYFVQSVTTDTFTIRLDSQPNTRVQLNFTSLDTDEFSVSPVGHIWTDSDWNTAKTVTVTGVADDQDDGNQTGF